MARAMDWAVWRNEAGPAWLNGLAQWEEERWAARVETGHGHAGRERPRASRPSGPDREKREFSIFQIFSTLFPNSNPNANQIKFE